VIVPVYMSYVLPLVFLILVTKGEAHKLILYFAWGLTAALGVYALSGPLDSRTSLSLAEQLVLVIPAIEELLKILPLFFVFVASRRKVNYSLTRCALAAGIGYSILENYVYLTLVSPAGSNPAAYMIMRSLTACLLHGSMSALIGYAFQTMATYRFASVTLFAGLYLTATSVHALYNLLGMTARWSPLAFLLPIAIFLFELFGVNLFSVRPARRIPSLPEAADDLRS
jgi:RsiW-degrading membrane proteinase PrsW (M82 family)